MKIGSRSLNLFVILLLAGGCPSVALENPAGAGTNPLVDEMASLDGVFRDVVSAVALGEGEKVHETLEYMHGAMEKTHEGVHAGKVVLPKNNDRMKEFIDWDKRFHEKLEALAQAGRRNNQKEMLALTKQLLDGCVQCHQRFRK